MPEEIIFDTHNFLINVNGHITVEVQENTPYGVSETKHVFNYSDVDGIPDELKRYVHRKDHESYLERELKNAKICHALGITYRQGEDFTNEILSKTRNIYC